MSAEIWHLKVTLMGKDGYNPEIEAIHIRRPDEEMQKDEYLFIKLYRGKLEGWKKNLVIEKESGFAKIVKTEWIKYLSDSFAPTT